MKNRDIWVPIERGKKKTEGVDHMVNALKQTLVKRNPEKGSDRYMSPRSRAGLQRRQRESGLCRRGDRERIEMFARNRATWFEREAENSVTFIMGGGGGWGGGHIG